MYMLNSNQEPSFEKSFITAKDTEVDRRDGRWFNPPVLRESPKKTLQTYHDYL